MINLYPLLANIATERMDSVGNQILTLLQVVAYWYIGLKCIAEVIKLAGSGDRKSVVNVILTYIMLFATCYMVPWIFDTIKTVFAR